VSLAPLCLFGLALKLVVSALAARVGQAHAIDDSASNFFFDGVDFFGDGENVVFMRPGITSALAHNIAELLKPGKK